MRRKHRSFVGSRRELFVTVSRALRETEIFLKSRKKVDSRSDSLEKEVTSRKQISRCETYRVKINIFYFVEIKEKDYVV